MGATTFVELRTITPTKGQPFPRLIEDEKR